MFSPFFFVAIAIAASNFLGVAAADSDDADSYSVISSRTIQTMQLQRTFPLGDPNANKPTYVNVYTRTTLSKRATTPAQVTQPAQTVMDLTPAKCTSKVCFPGWYGSPNQVDCDRVEAAQLYNSTGSLTALPGQIVQVYSGTCAVVFQNPIQNNVALQYNWASLGMIMQQLKKRCFLHDDPASGAACKIKQYLNLKLHNVVISVQHSMPPSDQPCVQPK